MQKHKKDAYDVLVISTDLPIHFLSHQEPE